MKQVTVEWVDAYSPTSVWVNPAEIPDGIPPKAIMTATGYLVKQHNDGIWLSMLHSPNDGAVGQIFFIPNGMVKNITENK
jgi:hypothetical protein